MKKKKNSAYGIIGLGRFGTELAKTLAEAEAEVIVIDNNEDKLKNIRKYVHEAFYMDAITREGLEEAGIGDCGTVIVCIGDKVDVNLLTTLNVLNLGVPRVLSKSDSMEHSMILEKIGAEAIQVEMDTAKRLASTLEKSNALDLINLNDDYIISEINMNKNFHNSPIKDLNLGKFDLKLVAYERGMETTITEFTQEDILTEDDAIIVIGKFADIDRFEKTIL